MYSQHQFPPYPVGSLPRDIQSFIGDVCHATQASNELVAPVVLSAMSAAVQGVVDVQSASGFPMPTSLYIGGISPSGGRKTSVLQHILKGFEEFENDNASGGTMPQILLEEATEPAVIDFFQQGAKSVFFAFSEGGQLLRALDPAAFSKRFDGATIRHATRKTGNIVLPNRRSALCLLIQGEILAKHMRKNAENLMDSGFMPRMLIADPSRRPSHSGNPYSVIKHNDPQNHLFHDRIRELLNDYADALRCNDSTRQVMSLDPDAQNAWSQFYQYTEDLLVQSSYDCSWEGLEAFVKRAGEQVRRVAAVLQWFERPQTRIEACYIDAACRIVLWHLNEAKMVFGAPSPEAQAQEWAQALYKYLTDRACANGGTIALQKSHLLRCAPRLIRKADRLDIAIRQLVYAGHVTMFEDGRKEYVSLQMSPMPNRYVSAHLSLH